MLIYFVRKRNKVNFFEKYFFIFLKDVFLFFDFNCKDVVFNV